jgi:Ice-binding-like
MLAKKSLLLRIVASTTLVSLPLASSAGVVPTRTMMTHRAAAVTSRIVLGPQLAPFALLAATTITDVGNTLVRYSSVQNNDDLMGVYPGTAVTGFYPPATDSGGPNAIYAAGYNANRAVPLAAQSALAVAYGAAAAAPATALVAGDLSLAKVPGYPTGTLPPGVYKSNTTLGIMSGNLTLVNGSDTAIPVFIFQVGTALTTTANAGIGGNIILGPGVSASNIYWQVGTSATLNGMVFDGNVLAYTSITLGATMFTGRALAMNGAITLPAAGGSLITNGGGF